MGVEVNRGSTRSTTIHSGKRVEWDPQAVARRPVGARVYAEGADQGDKSLAKVDDVDDDNDR